MDNAWLLARIAAIKTIIEAYEDAALALAQGGVQSYKLDTGQTVETVTRLDLEWINASLDGFYNKLVTLEARLTGNGVHHGRPAW